MAKSPILDVWQSFEYVHMCLAPKSFDKIMRLILLESYEDNLDSIEINDLYQTAE